MKAKKKVAVACLAACILLLLLTAFSGVNAWNQEADESHASQPAGETTAAAGLLQEEAVPAAETLPAAGTQSGEAESPDAEIAPASETPAQGPAAAEESLPQKTAPAEEAGGESASQAPAAPAESTAAGEAPAESAGETSQAQETTGAQETAGEGQPEETAADPETEEETTAAGEAAPVTETDYFADQFLVTVTGKTALNVREEPDTDSAWVGKMYAGSGGYILEQGDGWTKIQSGSVTGWVSNDYIVTGDAGKAKVLEECKLVIEVTSDALKVRSAPTTTEENKIRAIYGKETYPVVSEREGWVEIEYSEGKTGWVTAEYVTIRYSYEKTKSRREIEAEEEAKKRVNVKRSSRAAQSASVDDTTLLACLIQCESGSYEGQLAVANVILNRVNSPKYPNSISGVIYAAGQFGPVSSGSLARRLERGPSATALRAATDALNGTNNIGSFMHFRSAKSADVDSYSSYTIVAGNCFYTK